MDEWQNLKENLKELQKMLGYQFKNESLLLQAFLHKSYLNEHLSVTMIDNERLEFIGDSVFNLLVTYYLFEKWPNAKENELSLARSFLIDAARSASYLSKLGVSEYLVLGKGESQNLGRGRIRLYANLFEAIIGAIFLDGGFEKVKSFFLMHFASQIDVFLQKPLKNWKMELQDWAQKNLKHTPIYVTKLEEGPSHEKHFVVEVIVEDKVFGVGKGPSKKIAQMDAARDAMENIASKFEK